jgi:hypothetical protein
MPALLAAVRMWGVRAAVRMGGVRPLCGVRSADRTAQRGVRPQEMVKRNTLPLVYDPSRPARFGVLPKRPQSGKEVRARRMVLNLNRGRKHACRGNSWLVTTSARVQLPALRPGTAFSRVLRQQAAAQQVDTDRAYTKLCMQVRRAGRKSCEQAGWAGGATDARCVPRRSAGSSCRL